MIEVFLIYPTPEGSQEVLVEGGRLSLGRGDVDLRLDDDGMSRLNSTVYQEGENVWIIDENSTNGTFVNGQAVSPSGSILKNGDSIKIGNYTNIRVRIGNKHIPAAAPVSQAKPRSSKIISANATISTAHLIPIAITAFAVLVIGIAAIFIGVRVMGNNQPEIVEKTPVSEDDGSAEGDEDIKTKESPTPKKTDEKTPEEMTSKTPESLIQNNSSDSGDKQIVSSLPRKKYTEMSEPEKDQYIKEKAEKIARIIGNQSSEPIPPDAVKSIRGFLVGYVNRVGRGRKETGSCNFGSDMTVTLQRASKNAPFINSAFYGEGIAPEIGLYVAMIESEHCDCLESPTHAKGMFQFLASSAPDYGLKPEDRCLPEPSAKAAAKYLKSLTGRFGTGPMSVPLAIASYNSGQGGLSKNLEAALRAASSQERSFWTLVANQVAFEGSIGEQFRKENVKYVPKFFAAAIIGENPQDFGINMSPLSTYTK